MNLRGELSRMAWVGVVGLVGCGGANDVGADSLGPGLTTIEPSSGDETGSGDGDGTDTAEGGSGGSDCVLDPECPTGQICAQGTCVDGCSDDKPCADPALSCCDATCVDLLSDAENCGNCGDACDADLSCAEGACALGECEAGTNDCNGDASDGCETQGDCTCSPGETQSCYTGPAGTEGVGVCTAGSQTCNASGSGWGACSGDVTPTSEVCGNTLDDDCDGDVDEDVDEDGDGFGTCAGDCCDVAGPNCSNPELVNVGAFEVDGNMVDDDCDGTVDNPLPACDAGLVSNSMQPGDYARAIDLCQTTEEMPVEPEGATWGVISASLTLADGSGVPASNSRSIRDGFGSVIVPQFGSSIALLSSGFAADVSDTSPSFADLQEGQEMGQQSTVPTDWYAANGNSIPNAPGCPSPPDGFENLANDPVMLNLRIRAPTNANSFSVNMYFLSAEYPEWVCSRFNDIFVALIDSADPANPSDKNIAIYDDGDDQWPVGVNLVSAAPGLFTQCVNALVGECDGVSSNYTGCTSSAELAGTGFDVSELVFYLGQCSYDGLTGGGTGWLTMTGNVEPGEVFDLRLAIWDTTDALYDSTVLLDNWQWSVEASEPGVTPG